MSATPHADRFAAMLAASVWRAPEPIDCCDVAIGDTIHRLFGLERGVWEVTDIAPPPETWRAGDVPPGWSRMDQDDGYTLQHDGDLADPAYWRRVRCL